MLSDRFFYDSGVAQAAGLLYRRLPGRQGVKLNRPLDSCDALQASGLRHSKRGRLRYNEGSVRPHTVLVRFSHETSPCFQI